MPLHDVVALVAPPVTAFELGVLAEVFGLARSGVDLPTYDFAVATSRPGLLATTSGFGVQVDHGLERLSTADLVAVPSWDQVRDPEPEVVDALRCAVARGAQVLAVCSGAFLLGAAGLLDGRRAATHWRYAEALQERHPQAKVDADVLFVVDGPVTTSAGTAAGIDACLHLVREAHGPQVANRLARHMVVSPFREGGQAQLAEEPVPPRPGGDGVGKALDLVFERLAEPWPVPRLAREALMSERTFIRRFRAATGRTPARWLADIRLQAAEHLLETSDLPVEVVAARTGLGSADTLRRHLHARRRVSPAAYRQTYRGRAQP